MPDTAPGPSNAQFELSHLTHRCQDRRIDDLDVLNTELTAWQTAANADQLPFTGKFTTTDARSRLRCHAQVFDATICQGSAQLP